LRAATVSRRAAPRSIGSAAADDAERHRGREPAPDLLPEDEIDAHRARTPACATPAGGILAGRALN
ncbi:hypothetical protein, partial [Tsukamurella soli]|uniref:hypothetical protein n=1 Tax=Tsukamurella soli TaxID=644556 RepID=UPI0031F0E318